MRSGGVLCEAHLAAHPSIITMSQALSFFRPLIFLVGLTVTTHAGPADPDPAEAPSVFETLGVEPAALGKYRMPESWHVRPMPFASAPYALAALPSSPEERRELIDVQLSWIIRPFVVRGEWEQLREFLAWMQPRPPVVRFLTGSRRLHTLGIV